MAQQGYMPKQELQVGALMTKIGQKFPTYGPTCGFTPAEVTDVVTNSLFAAGAITLQNDVTGYAQMITRFKNAALWATEPITAYPAGYTLPMTMPVFGKAGAVALVMLAIARMKKHPGYTKQMGEDMGTEGADIVMAAAADLAAMVPVLILTLASGGHPNVGWKKKGMQGVKIQVDRNDGHGFVFLALDSEPDYLDTAALPAAGVTAVWKYRATYMQHDEEVGQWCDPVSITVTGI